MKVNREKLLICLDSVAPGVSKREIYDQSNSVIFKAGLALSFNGEVCCSFPSPFGKEFTGAIQAEKFSEIIRKLPDDDLEVEEDGDKLILRGKQGRKLRVFREAKITLPVDLVDKTGTWSKLPTDFADAVQLVGNCCVAKDEAKFWRTCIHVTEKFIEASDGVQVCRYRIGLGLKEPTIILQTSIRQAATLGVNEISETDKWLHFRNESGLILSCVRYKEEYPEVSSAFKVEGIATTLPKGLAEASERAKVYSEENPLGSQHIQVKMRPGKLWVIGKGVTGEYAEPRAVSYNGPEMSFFMKPDLLMKLVAQYSECEVTDNRLKVQGQKWKYIVCLVRDQNSKTEKNGDGE